MSATSSLDHDLLWYQQAANAATFLGAMGYGVHVAVFYKCINVITSRRPLQSIRWIPFIIALLVIGTANIACSLHFNQLAFIDQRDYPNGPAAFLLEQQSNPANVGAVATSIIMMIISDIFMIYRVHTLWRRPVVSGFMCLILLASIVMSAFHAIQLTKPETIAFLSGSSVIQFSVPYVSLATALNIIITVILTPRLLELRRQLNRSIASEIKEKFTSAEALIIESAAPTGLVSLIFIILFGLQKVSSILFLPLMVQIMAIIPGLIILRICKGYGWSVEVIRRMRPTMVHPPDGFTGGNLDLAMDLIGDRHNNGKSPMALI